MLRDNYFSRAKDCQLHATDFLWDVSESVGVYLNINNLN